MATKTEKISQEILDNINNLQNQLNGYIYDLGQISIRNRDLQKDIENLSNIKKDIESKFDTAGLQLENILSDLQKKYNNGEIDLNDGTVTFPSAE